MKSAKKSLKIGKLISWVIIIGLGIGVYYAYQTYQIHNFNDFSIGEVNVGISQFERDSQENTKDKRSYHVKSEKMNDAMFYQTIQVIPDTPYRITCMVKTNQIVPEKEKTGIGAHISVYGTTERSIAISGTQDWQKIELLINSKNRKQIDIAFRLGGYQGNCTGEAWFSDFTIEQGIKSETSDWKMACFFFTSTEVTIKNKPIKLQLTQTDISDISHTITRFETSCETLSKRKMTVKCDTYEIQEPITTLSYDKQFGYYVAPSDVEEQIKPFLAQNEYDHIFIIMRLGDKIHKKDIEINDWIGLGAMDYYGIGFSNIRLPNDSKDYVYQYNPKINTFPEEVLLHEFLHSLERTAKEYGYQIPSLHDYQQYGYQNEKLQGQKKWYTDYLNQTIKTTNNQMIGLPPEIYQKKPVKTIDFKSSFLIKEFQEPDNFGQEIQQIVNQIKKRINLIKQNQKELK